MAENRWYAVRESRDAAWDNGSDDYRTAVAMLKDQGHGLIAVIKRTPEYARKKSSTATYF